MWKGLDEHEGEMGKRWGRWLSRVVVKRGGVMFERLSVAWW